MSTTEPSTYNLDQNHQYPVAPDLSYNAFFAENPDYDTEQNRKLLRFSDPGVFYRNEWTNVHNAFDQWSGNKTNVYNASLKNWENYYRTPQSSRELLEAGGYNVNYNEGAAGSAPSPVDAYSQQKGLMMETMKPNDVVGHMQSIIAGAIDVYTTMNGLRKQNIDIEKDKAEIDKIKAETNFLNGPRIKLINEQIEKEKHLNKGRPYISSSNYYRALEDFLYWDDPGNNYDYLGNGFVHAGDSRGYRMQQLQERITNAQLGLANWKVLYESESVHNQRYIRKHIMPAQKGLMDAQTRYMEGKITYQELQTEIGEIKRDYDKWLYSNRSNDRTHRIIHEYVNDAVKVTDAAVEGIKAVKGGKMAQMQLDETIRQHDREWDRGRLHDLGDYGPSYEER